MQGANLSWSLAGLIVGVLGGVDPANYTITNYTWAVSLYFRVLPCF